MQTSTMAVDDFSNWQESRSEAATVRRYEKLIPLTKPGIGEQYAFEVNLDQCTGCKAFVVACHSLIGLNEDESWRDVGLLLGSHEDPYLQTVTTACHHCADPACSNGCPVLAYEKDADTGIVRHLDDQCIGCSYCILKCPYDVPKFNRKRGIVRKCDMCHERLAAGEAPACVQACPTQAIAIRIVPRQSNPAAMMPGLVDSSYTSPQTRYVGKKAIPASSVAADAAVLRGETAHIPLAVMLVLTQLAAGAWIAATIEPAGYASVDWIARESAWHRRQHAAPGPAAQSVAILSGFKKIVAKPRDHRVRCPRRVRHGFCFWFAAGIFHRRHQFDSGILFYHGLHEYSPPILVSLRHHGEIPWHHLPLCQCFFCNALAFHFDRPDQIAVRSELFAVRFQVRQIAHRSIAKIHWGSLHGGNLGSFASIGIISRSLVGAAGG